MFKQISHVKIHAHVFFLAFYPKIRSILPPSPHPPAIKYCLFNNRILDLDIMSKS